MKHRTFESSHWAALTLALLGCSDEAPVTESGPPPPTCEAEQALTWDGAAWQCVDLGAEIPPGPGTPPTCEADQGVTWDGESWACVDLSPTPSACGPDQTLTWNGSTWSCIDLPPSPLTCNGDELLYWDGTAWSCVSLTADPPSCGANQVLSYDGATWSCVDLPPQPPTCSDDQQLHWDGAAWSCEDFVDLDPPVVVATTPTDAEANVDTLASIDIVFSENVDPATVNSSDVRVVDSFGASVLGELRVLGSTVQLIPDEPLALLETYTIHAAGVTDTAGNALASPFTAMFTVRDGIWKAATMLEQGFDPGYAHIGVGKRGHAVVAWNDDLFQNGTDRLLYQAYEPGVGWHLRRFLDATVGVRKVVVGNDGLAVIAHWKPGIRVEACALLPPYDEEGILSQRCTTLSTSITGPMDVALSDAEAVLAMAPSHLSHTVQVTRYVEGSGWSSPLAIDNTTDPIGLVRVVQAGSTEVVVWSEKTPDPEDRLVARVSPTGSSSWTPAHAFTPLLLPQSNAFDVAVGHDGSAVVAFAVNFLGTDSIAASRWDPIAETWSLPALLDNLTDPAGAPYAGIDDSGHAVVVWQQSGNVKASRYDGAWSVPVDLGIEQGAQLTMDRRGAVMVTGIGPVGQISFQRMDRNGIWDASATAWNGDVVHAAQSDGTLWGATIDTLDRVIVQRFE